LVIFFFLLSGERGRCGMIISEDQLQDMINVITALKMKYKVFYIKSVEEADKELPPPDTVYIYVLKK